MYCCASLALLSALATFFSGSCEAPTERALNSVEELRASLPLSFEPNRGQADRPVEFLARGSGYNLFLTRTEAVLALKQRRNPAAPADRETWTSRSRTHRRMRMRAVRAATVRSHPSKFPGW